MLSGVILETEDSVRQMYKRALFLNYKKLIKKTPDEQIYVHSIFSLLLIRQVFEKNKSSRTAFKSQRQFWPIINYPWLSYGLGRFEHPT